MRVCAVGSERGGGELTKMMGSGLGRGVKGRVN